MPDTDSPRTWSERFAAALAKSEWFDRLPRRHGVIEGATRAEFWENWSRDALAHGVTQAQIWSAWFSAAVDASDHDHAQAMIAGLLDMTTGNVSKWYTGKGGPPRQSNQVIAVAHALGAPDAVAALYAAGMHATADLIRRETAVQPDDPMIARIHSETALTEEQRVEWIEEYRRQQAGIRHYFELRIAEAQRAKHARRRGHAKQPDANGGEPRRQAL